MTFPDRKYTDIAAFSDDYFDRERAAARSVDRARLAEAARLLTISASGDSENVVRAARWARRNDVAVIAFTGFSGGRKAGLANVYVDGDNYGVIEDTHQALMHILAQYIRQTHMSENLIADRKF